VVYQKHIDLTFGGSSGPIGEKATNARIADHLHHFHGWVEEEVRRFRSGATTKYPALFKVALVGKLVVGASTHTVLKTSYTFYGYCFGQSLRPPRVPDYWFGRYFGQPWYL
jgi:hypothetical protein